MKFEQKKWYPFAIAGLINIPEKGEHYILLHDSGRKMLLKADYYLKYAFEIGQIISCRVDKVNCTGQVFLEPKHPFYSEGQIFPFKFVKWSYDDDSQFNAIVEDVFENHVETTINPNQELYPGNSVLLKVIRVKKGIPILLDVELAKIKSSKSEGEIIKLLVKSIKDYQSENYYVISDENRDGIRAMLKVKHYINYNFKVGDWIDCVLVSKSNGDLHVEPKNPWYEIGHVYAFKCVGIEEYVDLDGNRSKIVTVLDLVGNKCSAKIDNKLESKIKDVTEVFCKVIGFKKGRPQVEIDLKYL